MNGRIAGHISAAVRLTLRYLFLASTLLLVELSVLGLSNTFGGLVLRHVNRPSGHSLLFSMAGLVVTVAPWIFIGVAYVFDLFRGNDYPSFRWGRVLLGAVTVKRLGVYVLLGLLVPVVQYGVLLVWSLGIGEVLGEMGGVPFCGAEGVMREGSAFWRTSPS